MQPVSEQPEDGEFLNVDLEVESEEDLAPLVAALEQKTHLLHSGSTVNGYRASFELPLDPHSADDGICGLADVVDSLSPEVRTSGNPLELATSMWGFRRAEGPDPMSSRWLSRHFKGLLSSE
jgi:hypothetical protein